jgi:hypothetical protein
MGGLNSGPHRSARLREERAIRFDVLDLQAQGKVENWPEGRLHTLAFRAPHTGTVISATITLTFTAERFGGRRIWWTCPECPRRVRYLYGGRRHISQPYAIACAECMRIVRPCSLEGPTRRWSRQMAKLEHRLGGDPRKIEPPKGNARRTFDRLAARHATYRAKVVAHAEERMRKKLRSRLWPTDPAALRAMRDELGLPTAGAPA